MQELTEREKQLLEIIKTFINVNTIYGLYMNSFTKLHKWKVESLESVGFGLEWQDKVLHTLENEFGLKYNKVDDSGKTLEETDGDPT